MNSNVKIQFNVGDLIKFRSIPFEGWAYVSSVGKLNDHKIIKVTSLTNPNRTSICDPGTISRYISNETVQYVPVIRIN